MTFATTVIPESHADILDQRVLAHVATIGPDGEPQNNPVWFDHQDGNIRFSQTTTRQKVRNMAKKYHGQEVYEGSPPGETRVVVVVRPEHTTKMG